MRRAAPPYFDAMLAARQPGDPARDVHLGFWQDDPAATDFTAAQLAMTHEIMGLALPEASSAILDVGCGFGGLLALLNRTLHGCRLAGVNIDPRQLTVCQELLPLNDNRLLLAAADACGFRRKPPTHSDLMPPSVLT